MLMSWLLAVVIAGSPSAQGVFLQLEQDGTQAAVPAPPSSESAQSDPGNRGTAGNEKKTPDDAAKKPVKESHAKKKAHAPRVRGRARRKARAVQPVADGEPRKIVVRQGGTQEPPAQIAPGMPQEEAARQRQSAEEMLVSAENHLKQLSGRTLDGARQETVAEIHSYMEKARSALQEGDTQRGHTLALKAYLLADDLVKH